MSNQVIERKPNGQYAKGSSGNLGGNAQRTRHMFSKAFVEALLEDFREWGPRSETPRVHNVAQWCGGVAARDARAAVGDIGDRVARLHIT